MNDLNFVVEIGRLTRDPELTYTQKGTAKLSFSIAVNRSVKQGNEWADQVSYFDVESWGRSAETVNQYLFKGKQVSVSGSLKQERWTAHDGSSKSRVVIVAEAVQLLGGNEQKQSYQQPSSIPQQSYDEQQEFPSEIPF